MRLLGMKIHLADRDLGGCFQDCWGIFSKLTLVEGFEIFICYMETV